MTASARERFAAAKATLDALDTAVGGGIRAIESELRDAGVAVPFIAYRNPDSDAPAVWWAKCDGAWGFYLKSSNTPIHGAPRHVRRAFFRAVTVDGLFDAASAVYRSEIGEVSP